MIFNVLNDLRSYLQTELPTRKFNLNYLPGRDAIITEPENSIYLTLLNISEDESSKIYQAYPNTGGISISYQNPPLVLELMVMISSFYQNYEEGLKSISEVIFKLNSKRKFSFENFTYSVSLQNISMEENSNLWQAISTNILPNVIYKIRLISQNTENPQPDEKPVITI